MNVFSQNIQALNDTDSKFLNELGIAELTSQYIEVIKKDDKEKIKSFSSNLTTQVGFRAQKILLDEGFDYTDLQIKPHFNQQLLTDCIQNIEVLARPYYADKLQTLIDSELFHQIDRAIFRFPFSRE